MAKRRSLRARRQRTRRTLLFWLSGGLLCGLGIIIIWSLVIHNQAIGQTSASTPTTENSTPPPLTTLVPGMTAPDLTLPIVRGGSYHLTAQRGHPIVLSFLATQPDSANTPSRSQAVSLLSMEHQYGPRGAKVVIIDASALNGASSVSNSQLLNVTYDWQLDTVPLLADAPNGATARAYGVQQLPTTFLIDASGQIVQRWNGLALSAQIGLALQQQVGAPAL